MFGMIECDKCDFKWSSEVEVYSIDYCPRCGEPISLTIE